jgi:ketosteroid isomerase-like protein
MPLLIDQRHLLFEMKNMKKALALLIFIIILSTACGSESDALHKLVEDYTQSVNRLDLNLAQSIWSQIDDVSFIYLRGHQKGWEEIRQSFYLGAMSNFSKRDLRIKNLSIRLIDENSAWGDFYWDFSAIFKDGKRIKTEDRETQIWKKEEGSRKIVHVHYSAMPVTGEREGF